MMPRTLIAVLAVLSGCVACTNESTVDSDVTQSPWMLVDDFESGLGQWTHVDVENNTDPFVPDPQIAEIRIDVEYFPNNQSFGLANVSASEIPVLNYESFEPMLRVTDRTDGNGYKNTGTLQVLGGGDRRYSNIIDPATGESPEPLQYFMTTCNTGPPDRPYGNGGVRYDDIYVTPGRNLTSPLQ